MKYTLTFYNKVKTVTFIATNDQKAINVARNYYNRFTDKNNRNGGFITIYREDGEFTTMHYYNGKFIIVQ